MQMITAIESQKRNPRRVNIYLDGEFAFGLSKVAAAWLKVGQTLDEEKITSLKNNDQRDAIYQQALHFLSYRSRSAAEVRRNLNKRNLPEELIEATLERLQQNGLVNDTAFTRAWIENRSEFHPRSKSALRLELRRKGIDDETILSALSEGTDEEKLALDAARKYLHKLMVREERGGDKLEIAGFREKMSGYLSRRGFAYSTIAMVVTKIWQELRQMADSSENTDNEENYESN